MKYNPSFTIFEARHTLIKALCPLTDAKYPLSLVSVVSRDTYIVPHAPKLDDLSNTITLNIQHILSKKVEI